MNRWVLLVSAVVAGLFITGEPGEASAHTRLTSPTPRSDSDGLKTGPCGNVARTGTPMTVNAGDTVNVAWLETINHPGFYRIALSLSGDDGFDDNILETDIADVNCTSTPCSYTQDITIPDVTCDDCTLQLIQFMGNQAPYSPYFSCADLEIIGTGGSPDAGAGDDDGGADGGCQVSGRTASSTIGTWLLVCLVLGASARRRRK